MNQKEFFSDAFVKFLDDPKYSWQFKDCYEAWVPIGWIVLVNELLDKINEFIPEETRDKFTWKQFKQKFGGLRAYYSFSNENDDSYEMETLTSDEREIEDKIFKLIDNYENKSCSICEVCAAQGKIITIGGYITTRCEEHSKER